MARTSYLQRRDGRYYLQVRVARHATPLFGKALFRTALQTADFRTARRRLHHCLPWVFSMNESIDFGGLFRRNVRNLETYLNDMGEIDEDRLFARRSYEEMLKNLNRRAEARGFEPTLVDPDYMLLFHRFVQENVRADSVLRKRERDDAYERGRSARIKAEASEARRQNKGDQKFVRRVRISEAFEHFVKHTKEIKRDERARGEVGPIVQFLIDMLGDPFFADLTPEQLKQIDTILPAIPNRTNIPAPARNTLAGRYRYAQENGWDGLHRLTEARLRNGYHTALSRFFGWAITEGLFAGPKPIFHCVSEENLAALPRDAFEDDEVLKIVSMPLFTGCAGRTRIWTPGGYLIQNHLYWGYLILLLTGMRAGEVGQLRSSDVIKHREHFFFDLRPFDPRKGRVPIKELRNLKTANSSRIIPINPLLIDLGLLDRVEEMGRLKSDRLFPEWAPYRKSTGELRWGQPMTKSWQYLKTVLMLGRADITLYSTRHWMADMLDEAGAPQRLRNRLMGHSDQNNVPDQYGRKARVSPKQTEVVIGVGSELVSEIREILVEAKHRADRGELKLLKPWLNKKTWATITKMAD